jgi:glucose/arabinose dehydrogenase
MRSKPSLVAIGLSLVMLFFSRASMAQQTQQSTEQAKTVSAPATDQPAAPKLILKDGTDVQLKFAQDLTSKTAAEGDPVSLVLDQDLKVGDVVVVKAGAKAVGTITHSKKAGMMGKAGELNMRLEYLIAIDNRVKLRGSKGKEGEGKEGATVALTVLFGPIGLIKHGKNVEIKDGTPLLAYLDENYPLPAANPK